MLRLEPYDTDWPLAYSIEAERVKTALGRLAAAIEHVGSTAVPGLLSKPVIDIGVAVHSLEDADACISLLEHCGYQYRGQHGDDPDRRYFVLEREGTRYAQLHLYILPALGWDRMLRFRNLLCARPELAAAYAAEKLRVARLVGWDKAAYSIAKGPFIDAVLREAGSSDETGPSGESRTR